MTVIVTKDYKVVKFVMVIETAMVRTNDPTLLCGRIELQKRASYVCTLKLCLNAPPIKSTKEFRVGVSPTSILRKQSGERALF